MKNEKSWIGSAVFLVQTDTTVGLLSKNAQKLAKVKKRDEKQPFLESVATFKELKEQARIPKKFKKLVRRKKKTTFVYPNKKALRVVKSSPHQDFLKKFGRMYSTSANKTGYEFDFSWIKDRVDIIVYDAKGFAQKSSSSLYQLNRQKMRRLR
jgi:tRNA A37 threonylcarbamoyladenosine synthetase subunit TsaC/SUA5/YrdC